MDNFDLVGIWLQQSLIHAKTRLIYLVLRRPDMNLMKEEEAVELKSNTYVFMYKSFFCSC